jgi:hypothetical protein
MLTIHPEPIRIPTRIRELAADSQLRVWKTSRTPYDILSPSPLGKYAPPSPSATDLNEIQSSRRPSFPHIYDNTNELKLSLSLIRSAEQSVSDSKPPRTPAARKLGSRYTLLDLFGKAGDTLVLLLGGRYECDRVQYPRVV